MSAATLLALAPLLPAGPPNVVLALSCHIVMFVAVQET